MYFLPFFSAGVAHEVEIFPHGGQGPGFLA